MGFCDDRPLTLILLRLTPLRCVRLRNRPPSRGKAIMERSSSKIASMAGVSHRRTHAGKRNLIRFCSYSPPEMRDLPGESRVLERYRSALGLVERLSSFALDPGFRRQARAGKGFTPSHQEASRLASTACGSNSPYPALLNEPSAFIIRPSPRPANSPNAPAWTSPPSPPPPSVSLLVPGSLVGR